MLKVWFVPVADVICGAAEESVRSVRVMRTPMLGRVEAVSYCHSTTAEVALRA